MSLNPGTRLGPYEILSPLGAGGMGEVYRAKDTRLGRDVAVKVLPQHMAAAPEARARFDREAKTISGLNHPHICTLFDVGHEGDTDYLVMELVEGETLADRLAKGPLPLAQVVRVGVEIADALDRAHRAGVIHRDLKPGNVMLTKRGAKLMDFGLARVAGLGGLAGGSDATVGGLSRSPTMSQPLTAGGTILGTFQYMAPEQLEGRDADARTDLWSFGCVLYEMATGRRAFEGRSQASLISSIMGTEPPPISAVAPLSPPALDHLVRGCLAKDPEERIQTAHDVKLQLEWALSAGSTPGVAAPVIAARKSRGTLGWVVAAAAIAALAAALVVLRPKPAVIDPVVTEIPPPSGTVLAPYWSAIGLSPDGRTVAFFAADSLGQGLWVRSLGSETARPLPETRDVLWTVFWSYDSRALCYFTEDGKLKRISVDGGSPLTLCNATAGRGGTCNRDGDIVFAPAPEGPLLRVASGGGETTPVTTLDTARHETSHRFPCFLPDGDHFLYVALPPGPNGLDTYVASLKSKTVKKILTAQSSAMYAEPGYLLFAREDRIMAQRFDAGRLALEGEATAIGNAPDYSDMDAEPVSVSRNGRLVVLRSEAPATRLEWLDGSGVPRGGVPLPAGRWEVQKLSPDGRHALVMNGPDIWNVDLERAMPTRVAETKSTEATLVWAPDSRRMAFVSKMSGRSEIYVASADGAGEPELIPTTDAQFKYITDWSPDGKYIVFMTVGAATTRDIWVLPMEGGGKPESYLSTPFTEAGGRISPDGRWMAYYSDESGGTEIYVQSFPKPGRKVRISSDGGDFPFWLRGGSELGFFQGGTVMVAPVEGGEDFLPGTPRPIFTLHDGVTGRAVTGDGERWLVSAAAEAPHRSIRLFVNWIAALPAR